MVASARLIFSRRNDVMVEHGQPSKQVCLVTANGIDIRGADAN